MERWLSQLRRNGRTGAKVWQSSSCRSGEFILFYPGAPWYEENAPEMLRLLGETKTLLEEGLRLRRDREILCLVAKPEWTSEVLGVAGLALRDTVVVACPARCLSQFAAVAAHELAHLLAWSLGASETPFKAEGFACYSAEIIDAATRPFGVPLHHHLVWMLSVGLRPTLPELWHRQDYSPELYDLAWSFTTFVVETFGLERYARFYGAVGAPLDARVRESLGLSVTALEQCWYATARESVDVPASAIARQHRHLGMACSRAAWLGSR